MMLFFCSICGKRDTQDRASSCCKNNVVNVHFTEENKTKESSEGIKHDNNKPDLTDIPLEALWQMGEAFTYGQRKYAKSNFRKGMLVSRQLAAAVRHIFQHLAGQTYDIESGVTHLGHALASIAMACYTLANHPHLDDRYEGDKAKHNNSVVKAT